MKTLPNLAVTFSSQEEGRRCLSILVRMGYRSTPPPQCDHCYLASRCGTGKVRYGVDPVNINRRQFGDGEEIPVISAEVFLKRYGDKV